MKKRILLSLLCGMLAVGGVLGLTETSWAQAEKSLTLPDGLFEGSSSFELRYESGSLDPASLNGSALGVRFYEKGEAFGHAEKVSIVSTGSLAGSDLVVEELIIDGLVLDDKGGDRLAIERLKMISSGTWDGGNLVVEKLEVDGFDAESGSSTVSIRTLLMKSLSVAELMVAGVEVSNAAIPFKDLDPEALQRGDMGPMDQENAMALVGTIKDVAGLLDGFSLTLNDIQVVNDGQSGSLGKVAFGVRDSFWLPEFSIERLNIPNFGGQAVELEAVRFELAGSLSSRLSALFEIVGLALRPGETAPQTVREFFEMLDMEEVVVDFGTQLITTVEQEETLVEINVAFGVPELMGLNIKFANRSPTNPVAFLGSSKFADLTQEERQAAMKEIMTQGRLDHASVTLTNWNAVDILLKALAQQGGQSEEQLRMTGEMMINRFVGRGTPALAEANDALVAFLKTPGTLQASFRPPKPLPTANTSEFNELVANPAALVDALGLSVKFFDEPMSIESHRLTQPQGLTESKNAGISTNGTPKALPPIPDSNVLDWLSARRAYVEEDYETVLRLMVPHAEIGTESAQRVVAHSYRKTDEFEQAATWYQGLAEKGDAASQFYLGMLYQKGLGVEQDNQVALEWLEKAVAQGDARAIHALALSTQTIEVVKEINPGLSARAKEVLTDVVRHYYDTDDPAGMHFSGKSDVLIPTALWDRVIARWRAEDVMPSHVILQAVAGRDVGKKTSTESPSPESQVAPPEAHGYEEGKVPGTISEGVSKVREYVGELKDGKKHGQGAYTWADGDKYVGEWKEGKMHGQGTKTTPDGYKYVGEWKDDTEHGQGAYTWADGSKYVGEWKDGWMHGQGTKTTPDGSKYVGEFKDSEFHGQGTSTYANGDKYVGEWKDGKRYGQGTHTYTDGIKHVGEWKDDDPWEGIVYDKDGSVIDTYSASESQLTTTGTIAYSFEGVDGTYTGELVKGTPHGQGTLTFYYGRAYVGEWKDGKKHGQGTSTYADGTKFVGEYKDNYSWEGIVYDKDGNALAAISRGVKK